MYLQRITAILFVSVNLLINGIRCVEVVRGDTATIVCDIAGTFVSPSWDDGTASTVYIAEGQASFNPSTTDSGWSRSSDTKNLIITSIEDSDAGTYRCGITSPTPESYTATLTVTTPTAGLDGTCSSTAPIIECSTENAECSATNKCQCKTGYEPNAAATECITVPTTTSPPVNNVQYHNEAVAELVVQLVVTLIVLVVLILIILGIINIDWAPFVWQILLGGGIIVLLVVSVSGGYHVHINSGDRDGALWPWYVIVSITMTALEVVAFIFCLIVACSGFSNTEGTSHGANRYKTGNTV